MNKYLESTLLIIVLAISISIFFCPLYFMFTESWVAIIGFVFSWIPAFTFLKLGVAFLDLFN